MPTVKDERRTTNRKPATRPRQSAGEVAEREAAQAVERVGQTMDGRGDLSAVQQCRSPAVPQSSSAAVQQCRSAALRQARIRERP